MVGCTAYRKTQLPSHLHRFIFTRHQPRTGNNGNLRISGKPASSMLQTKRLNVLGGWANKDQTGMRHGSCKLSIFRQEAVARDDGVCAMRFGYLNDLVSLDIELANSIVEDGSLAVTGSYPSR